MPDPSDAACDRRNLSSSEHSSDAHQEQSHLSPWQRIKRTLDFATTRIEPGEPVGLGHQRHCVALDATAPHSQRV